MRPARPLLLIAVAVPLAACQSTGQNVSPFGGTNTTLGTLGGAAAGGLLGSTFGGGTGNAIATLAGTLVGGFLGNRLGNQFDDNSKQQAAQAERRAVASGEPTAWRNPDAHTSGHVQPTRNYRDEQGRLCRDYTTTIEVGGREETGNGTACREPDGSWKLVNG